jgi:hypothetical protein
MQSFLKAPNFNKKFFYKQSQNKYQEFCNAYAYYKQATLCDSQLNRQKLSEECTTVWKEIKKNDAAFIDNKIYEYYETIPSTVRSHQRIFMSRNTTTGFRHTPTASTSRHISAPNKIILILRKYQKMQHHNIMQLKKLIHLWKNYPKLNK